MPKAVEEALAAKQFPLWLAQVVEDTKPKARAIAQHEAWKQFSAGTISEGKHHLLLSGFWPLIERFPQFLALNLLKCSYGSHSGVNAARGWLIKNLRIEQRHAEWYRDWAEYSGISRSHLYEGHRPAAMTAITDWCWHVCESGSLAEGMVATNFAIEGVTGDWTEIVWESQEYRLLFKETDRKKAMKWIQVHAAYDDVHPVEALSLINKLLGDNPRKEEIRKIRRAIEKSYDLYLLALDAGMEMVPYMKVAKGA
ncbi:MAG: iron-containing redox enzyme family protein [Nitrospira sp.]|nr:iron-containing redox enzyme family protein [Nitrospira sp.]